MPLMWLSYFETDYAKRWKKREVRVKSNAPAMTEFSKLFKIWTTCPTL